MQQLGLFEVLTKVIASGSPAVKLRATDILLSTLGHDPLPLRSFLTRQAGHELLGLLVREMLGAPDDSGLPEQIAELLKVCGERGLFPWQALQLLPVPAASPLQPACFPPSTRVSLDLTPC